MKQESIVFTNDNCIGCNKCIKVCSAVGACISKEEDGKARIIVDGSKCVSCGSCIDVCVHGAREFEDDTERFFKDLEKGERISLLLAPAFKANYPDRYESVLKRMKKLGVTTSVSEISKATASSVSVGNIASACEALAVLGYTSDDVMPILSGFDPTLKVEELIHKTLVEIGKK